MPATCSNPTPWIKSDRTYHPGMLGLHEEILDFCCWIAPSPAEQCMRQEVMRRVSEVISDKFCNAMVDYFGSYRTGLYLPSSDIDIVLLGDWSHFPLHCVKEELAKAGMCSLESIKVLDRASVPIIKLTDQLTDVKVRDLQGITNRSAMYGFCCKFVGRDKAATESHTNRGDSRKDSPQLSSLAQIDVSFNMISGLSAAELVRSFMDKYPPMPMLVMVLKQFLQQHGLNESFTGGIGSYALVLLTVSFLQLHPHYGHLNEPANLGVLLLEFLELYGRHFNFIETAIRVKDGGSYVCKEEIFGNLPLAQKAPVFSIEDPLQPGNDVGRTSYAAPQVKLAFESAYYHLIAATLEEPGTAKENGEPETASRSILGRIIQISDELNAYRERAEREYGCHPSIHRLCFPASRLFLHSGRMTDYSGNEGLPRKGFVHQSLQSDAAQSRGPRQTILSPKREPGTAEAHDDPKVRDAGPSLGHKEIRLLSWKNAAAIPSTPPRHASTETTTSDTKEPIRTPELHHSNLPLETESHAVPYEAPSSSNHHPKTFGHDPASLAHPPRNRKNRNRGGWDESVEYYQARNWRTRWFGQSRSGAHGSWYLGGGERYPRKSASEIIQEFELRAQQQEGSEDGSQGKAEGPSV